MKTNLVGALFLTMLASLADIAVCSDWGSDISRSGERIQRLTSSPHSAILQGMTYPGGKNGAGVYQTIINLMPPHEVYIEPFLGGGAVMRAKRPARVNIGVDLVASALLTVQGSVATLAGNGGEILRQASIVGNGDARDSADLARGIGGDGVRGESPETELAGNGVGSSFEFHQTDGIAFLEAYRFTGSELVYCDPPYLMTRRKGRRLYEHEMNAVDHRRLLRVLQELNSNAMVSGYWSKLYADALQGWNHVTYETMTRGGTKATEWLWFNFPAPVELHDYRYLGQNFRERERIKRKKNRWTARLLRMPALERQALLAAIAATARSSDVRSPHAGSGDGARRL